MKLINKKILVLVTTLFITVSTMWANPQPEEFKLNIISTSDVHGFGLTPSDKNIGFSRMVGYANTLTAEGKEVLMLDAGDMIAGNAATNLDRGISAIDALNVVQYDAMTMGNHATDFGPERFLELTEKMEYPYVVANLFHNDEPLFEPYIIKTINKVDVAIVGLVTPEYGSSEFYYEDPVKTMNRLMPELKTKATVVIVLAHLGNEREMTSRRLAENVKGIDLILDGHDHVPTPEGTVVGDTLIVNSGSEFSSIGYTTLTIVDGVVTSKTAKLVDMSDETLKNSSDDAVDKILGTIKAKNDKVLGEVLAVSPEDLEGTRAIIRTSDTNLGRLVTDAFRADSGADISFMNAGWIRSSASKGEITMQDVLNILAMGGSIATIPMTGEEILSSLEMSFAQYPEANGFLMQVSGLTCDVDTTKPVGQRVSNVIVGDSVIDKNSTYKVAVLDILAQIGMGARAGNEKYAAFAIYGGGILEINSISTEALANYLKTTPDAFSRIEQKRMNIN